MPSIHEIELQDKFIRIKDDTLLPNLPLREKIFQCTGGFGCNPNLIGIAIFVTQISSGSTYRISREEIERLATDKEIQLAKGDN